MNIKEIRWKRGDVDLVLDPDRNTLVPLLRQTALDRIPIGLDPTAAAFDGAFIWVANFFGGIVSKIDIATNGVVATVGAGSGAGVAFDGTFIWVTNYWNDLVSKIDMITNKVVHKVDVGKGPYGSIGNGPNGIAFDGTFIWVTNFVSNTVSKVDIVMNKVVNKVSVETAPRGVAFDGAFIWVANSGSNTMSKINVATNKVVKKVEVGSRPWGVAFDGDFIWLTNYSSNTVREWLKWWANEVHDVGRIIWIGLFGELPAVVTKGEQTEGTAKRIWTTGETA